MAVGRKRPTSLETASEPDIDRLARENPKVNVEQYREGQALLETLRQQGLSRPRYNLAQPFERRARSPHLIARDAAHPMVRKG